MKPELLSILLLLPAMAAAGSIPLSSLEQIPLQGVTMLQLRVDDGGDGIQSDHADWANAVIDYQGEPPAACAPPPPPARWQLGADNSTIWKIGGSGLPHADFIEQGGRRAGQKVWYEIGADQTLKLERDVVWPSLRIIPNDTHGSLVKHYGPEAEPRISVDGRPLGPVRISAVVLDGTLTFHGAAGNLAVERITFPAFGKYAAIDRWLLTNQGSRPAGIAVAPLALTAEAPGPHGLNRMEVVCDAPAATTLPPGGTLAFSIHITARQDDMPRVASDGAGETALRRDFIDRLTRSLRLETPDPVLNRAFTFAKWRVAEAINDTRGGMMLAPGNLRYYAGNSKLRAWICMPLSMGIFDRRQATIDALFSPAMWTADGLATQAGDRVFWDRSTLYALGAVFKAGETTKALDFLTRYTRRRLLGEHVPYAVEAYPEGGQGHLASESGLYCRIYLEGMFGILPTGLDRFQCVPRLPAGWPSMALRSIRAFGREFDLVVTRAGSQNRIRVLQHGLPLVDRTVAPGAAIEVVLPPPSNP